MLRPISPIPPSATIRSTPGSSGAGAGQLVVAGPHASNPATPAAARSARRVATCCGRGVDQGQAHRPGGQPQLAQRGLGQDHALRAEHAHVGRDHRCVERRCRATSPARCAAIISAIRRAEDVSHHRDHADGADREQRQGQGVIPGVPGQVGAGDHRGRRGEVGLGVLVGHDPGVLSDPGEGVGLDRHARAPGDVVGHDRQVGGVGDRQEVRRDPRLGRLVVVRASPAAGRARRRPGRLGRCRSSAGCHCCWRR